VNEKYYITKSTQYIHILEILCSFVTAINKLAVSLKDDTTMRISLRQIFVTLIVGLTLTSCRQNEVDGIIIGDTLYENQSITENRKLRQLIRQTLDKDEKALVELNDFWCGGGAGCYDLGFVVTQIIYRLGEKDFMTIVAKLDNNKTNELEDLIMAGLEYGDNDKDGKMDNKRLETEFPKLYKLLKSKQ
jgi:hypothetical protein